MSLVRGHEPLEPGDPRPLVLHLVYRFDTGGLENGVVNLINHGTRYRHTVVAMTEVAPGFSRRVQRADVGFHALHKPPGHGAKLYPKLVRLFKQLKPAVVHSRNLGALECQVAAWWAGVPARVHGEHGRDIDDPDGTRRSRQWLRRAYRPFVHQYVALSQDLAHYLSQQVGVPARRLNQIYNGVDLQRFERAGVAGDAESGTTVAAVGATPAAARWPLRDGPGFAADCFVVGTVGRMAPIKAQTFLTRGFILALAQRPDLAPRLRLVMVGDGPLRAECQQLLSAAGLAQLAWLPGERADVPDVMRSLDCFMLPSMGEGISNTILEAMASGLPVLATRVGGNPELVVADGPEATGALVAFGDVPALAAQLVALADAPDLARQWGAAGRARVVQQFSLPTMVARYEALYDQLLQAPA